MDLVDPETKGFELTPSQENTLKEIDAFLHNNYETCICLSGSPGTGKSFFINECIPTLVPFEPSIYIKPNSINKLLVLTATTNKAAAVIGGVTVHNYFGIKVQNDYTTGKTSYDTKKCKFHRGNVIVIDEASMLDAELWDIILSNSSDCKFILVGDMYQLPAVGANADVFNKYRVVELTDVVRQKDPTFLNVIATAKEGVLQKTILDLPDSPCIKYKTLADREELIWYFTNFNSSTDKVLCYTNEAAVYYSHCIRLLQGKTDDLYIGDLVTSRSFVSQRGETIHIEDVLRIKSISKPRIISFYGYQLSIRDVTFKDKRNKYMVAASWQEFAALLKMIAKDKKWRAYFNFKDTILDLRSIEACTVHCSQGSTYERVFIDYNDLMKCKAHNIRARLYYVALSRAKHEVIIFKE